MIKNRKFHPYVRLLIEYGDWIEAQTDERVDVKIKRRPDDEGELVNFTMQPLGRPTDVFKLLRIRIADVGPSFIEVFHLEESSSSFRSEMELSHLLDQILKHKRTQEIIDEIASKAVGHVFPARSAVIGAKMFETPRGKMAHVSFFGLGGFVSKKTLEQLAKNIEEGDAAYLAANGGIIATFKFEGSVKVTLTRQEYEALQEAAKTSLKG